MRRILPAVSFPCFVPLLQAEQREATPTIHTLRQKPHVRLDETCLYSRLAALFSPGPARRLGYDVPLTYMPHPGTGFYAGCTDIYENVYLHRVHSPQLQRTLFPGASTGRQIFVKPSYMLRHSGLDMECATLLENTRRL
ncbi:MAG TPA: hypothetical protein VF767_05390 [Bryobacteraceae bacterium]